MKKLSVLLLAVMLAGIWMRPLSVAAEVPYKTYTVDGYGRISETQAAYTPLTSITKFGDHGFEVPMDMTITESGKIYVADAGTGEILIGNIDGEYLGTVGTGELTEPTGVFVTEDETLYVADKGGSKIAVFDQEGELIETYGIPDHPLYGKSEFKPSKIIVNSGGDMYVICEGNSNGIVQISPNDGGTFLGYFGTNYASVSLLRMVQETVYNDQQLARMVSNLPSTPANMAIDEKGLIYTVTPGEEEDSLKKLNIAGKNMIEPDAYDGREVAVTTGNYENIFVASSDGYVYEYNGDGELLFIFGGRDDGRFRIGLSSRVEAIQTDPEDNVYILDSDSQQIQVFETTEFTDYLHEALYLYSKGRYTESKEPLTEVLEMNSLFDYANKAMGRAYYQEENYTEALTYSRLSKDVNGYSDAFWEIRNIWLRDNLVLIAAILIGLYVLVKAVKYLQKRRGTFDAVVAVGRRFGSNTLVRQVGYLKYYCRHPMDGAYGVKREGMNSWACTVIIMSGVAGLSVIGKYFGGFLFKTIRDGRYELVQDVGLVALAFVFLTGCCYLVCAITDGEAHMKQLFSGFAYSFAPYIIMQPMIILTGNVITYNESFVRLLMQIAMLVWIVILLVTSIKEINNYTVRETVRVIFLTVFAALIFALLIFIMYVLCRQVVEFVIAFFREVVYRLG